MDDPLPGDDRLLGDDTEGQDDRNVEPAPLSRDGQPESSLQAVDDSVFLPDHSPAKAGDPVEQCPPGHTAPARQSVDDGFWLGENDLVPSESPPRRGRLPGPGLPEALAWVLGVFGMQMFAGTIMSLVVIGTYVATLSTSSTDMIESLRDPAIVEQLVSEHQLMFIGGTMLIIVVAVVLAVWLRLGKTTIRRLSLTPTPLRHCLLIAVLIPPLMVVSQQLYIVADAVWARIVEQFPGLSVFDAMNAMEIIDELAGAASIPILLLIIAVAPAVWEELLFRGVIGRGLTARWGLPVGVLLTSCLFAMVHIHPAHVVGVLPLGIAMHLVYLATRSFWAPVLLHFLNNGVAVLALKIEPIANAEQSEIPPLAQLMAVLCIAAIGTLMWRTRVGYRLPDGSSWNPGYVTVEQPPAELRAVRRCGSADAWLIGVTALVVVSFFWSLVPATAAV